MKKFLAILCAFICFCAPLCLSVCAEASPTITVSSKTAVSGDVVNIPINIKNNPGIMAMTFGVKYNPSAFTFLSFAKGYLTDYTVFDDKANFKINIVNCEDSDIKKDGNIIILQFAVNNNAPLGFHPIEITPINSGETLKGCFADSHANSIIPEIINGQITVGAACIDTPHTFSEYNFDTEPTCIKQGLKSRYCILCGHTESEIVSALGHDFESFWTVDREATANLSGIISRHCKNCDATADVFTFEADDAKSGIPNQKGNTISPDVLNRLQKFAELLSGKADRPSQTDPSFDEPFFTHGNKNDSDLPNAQQLIDSHGKINMSLLLEKIYGYLFGNEESSGIFNVIYEYFSGIKFNPLWLILIILII